MIFPKFYGPAVSDVAKEDVVGSAYSCLIHGCWNRDYKRLNMHGSISMGFRKCSRALDMCVLHLLTFIPRSVAFEGHQLTHKQIIKKKKKHHLKWGLLFVWSFQSFLPTGRSGTFLDSFSWLTREKERELNLVYILKEFLVFLAVAKFFISSWPQDSVK